MRKLLLISAVGTLAGYAAVHFAFFAHPKPALQSAEPVAVAGPAEPVVVLANVIDVTDTDPLLDQLPAHAVGTPFDTVVPIEFTTPAASKPIPLAEDEPEE